MMHRLLASLLLGTAAALVPHRPTQRLQPLYNDVIDVSESAVVERLENSPYPSLVEKVEPYYLKSIQFKGIPHYFLECASKIDIIFWGLFINITF